MIPDKYEPELLDEKTREGYLNWSLDFFTETNIIQCPYLNITLQLDITKAYEKYQFNKRDGSTFFSFLMWHFMQSLKNNWCFNLRLYKHKWYILKNPPIMVTVAMGGKNRFWEMLLENVSKISYPEFVEQYREKITAIKAGKGKRADLESFCLSCIFGNLPNLQFTELKLHWRQEKIAGQPWFYFGKRYYQNNKLYIPLAIKLHHSNTDPLVLNLLIQDFQKRF